MCVVGGPDFESEFLLSSFSKVKTQWQVHKESGERKATSSSSNVGKNYCRNAQQRKSSSPSFSH